MFSLGNGFFKIGSIIIQYGEVEIPVNKAQSGEIFNFPTSFTDRCLTIVATDVGGEARAVGLSAISKTQFRAFAKDGTTPAGSKFHWLAIGF